MQFPAGFLDHVRHNKSGSLLLLLYFSKTVDWFLQSFWQYLWPPDFNVSWRPETAQSRPKWQLGVVTQAGPYTFFLLLFVLLKYCFLIIKSQNNPRILKRELWTFWLLFLLLGWEFHQQAVSMKCCISIVYTHTSLPDLQQDFPQIIHTSGNIPAGSLLNGDINIS